MSTTTVNREFRLENQRQFDQRSPVRWIASQLRHYWHLPLLAVIAAGFNNFGASYIQLLIGRGFDLLNTPGWTNRSLLLLALAVFGSAAVQGIFGLVRNSAFEFMAQRVERDSRDSLYASLLGKSQTFHNRQRVGDIMARASNDVRQLNPMLNPGVALITDSMLSILMPLIFISFIDIRLLAAPLVFLSFLCSCCATTRAGSILSPPRFAAASAISTPGSTRPSPASRSSSRRHRKRRRSASLRATPPTCATSTSRKARCRLATCRSSSSALH